MTRLRQPCWNNISSESLPEKNWSRRVFICTFVQHVVYTVIKDRRFGGYRISFVRKKTVLHFCGCFFSWTVHTERHRRKYCLCWKNFMKRVVSVRSFMWKRGILSVRMFRCCIVWVHFGCRCFVLPESMDSSRKNLWCVLHIFPVMKRNFTVVCIRHWQRATRSFLRTMYWRQSVNILWRGNRGNKSISDGFRWRLIRVFELPDCTNIMWKQWIFLTADSCRSHFWCILPTMIILLGTHVRHMFMQVWLLRKTQILIHMKIIKKVWSVSHIGNSVTDSWMKIMQYFIRNFCLIRSAEKKVNALHRNCLHTGCIAMMTRCGR